MLANIFLKRTSKFRVNRQISGLVQGNGVTMMGLTTGEYEVKMAYRVSYRFFITSRFFSAIDNMKVWAR